MTPQVKIYYRPEHHFQLTDNHLQIWFGVLMSIPNAEVLHVFISTEKTTMTQKHYTQDGITEYNRDLLEYL